MSAAPRLVAKLNDALRESPATVPALLVVGLCVLWATDQAGYPLTHWAPGTLVVLALVAIAASNVPLRLREVPLAVRVAVGALALYTLLSYLSIVWAAVPADAWEGANRTLLYLLVFALFALWPQRGLTGAVLVCTWTVAMIVLAVVVLLHIDSAPQVGALFNEGRLKYPAGYENASAATWAIAMWPALLLAAASRIPWFVRGVLAGGTVLLANVALLSESRGMLFATPVMLVLIFAFVPGRLRTFAVLVPIAAAIGLSAPATLHVGDRLVHGGNARVAMHSATAATLIAAALAAAAVALGAAFETHRKLSPAARARARRVVGGIAIATLIAVLAGGWAAAGDPLARTRHAWDTFMSKRGYAANGSGNRLISGFGSERHDFYRVALDEFVAHPLIGIGADNFQQQYLQHRRTNPTPRYPHSVELRTLVQSGLVGTLVAAVGLVAALAAATASALRRRSVDPLGGTVAAAALAAFVYWLVHGSFDWFWEFAGLGAPAFAMLGLACALVRRTPAAPASDVTRLTERLAGWRPAQRRALIGAAVLMSLLAVASLLAPWLSALQVESAARIWRTAPRVAYRRLEDAARLNPLSDSAYLLAGSIALRFDDIARADREFASALQRVPGDAYAVLERGAIASIRGERRMARILLERAVKLNPYDQLTRRALAVVREGKTVDLQALNDAILLKAQQLA